MRSQDRDDEVNSGNTTSKPQARQLLNSGTQKHSDGCNREPINQTGSASNSDGGMIHKPNSALLSKDDPESDDESSGDAEDKDGDGDDCESGPKLDTATSSNAINEPLGRANVQFTSAGLHTHIDHDDDQNYDGFDSDNSVITHEHMWLPNIRYLQIDVEPGSREAERVHEIRRYLEDLQRRRAAIERKFEFRINQPPFYAMYMGGSGGGSNVFL